MPIWVDADACPIPVKEILYRAAHRAQVVTTLVANQGLRVPPPLHQDPAGGEGLRCGRSCHRPAGQARRPGDHRRHSPRLLGHRRRGEALNPRDEIYTRETIQARLGMRNFMEELRSAGVQTGGPAPFNAADKQRFANALDKWLVRGQAELITLSRPTAGESHSFPFSLILP